MRDGHCIEDRHGWNITNFKNPRHTFVWQHLRNVQAKSRRNLPNFGILLIRLFAGMTHGHFRGHFCNFLLWNSKKTWNSYFFRNLHLLSFPTIYSLPCFPLKWRVYEFFPRGHGTPTKVRSNLKYINTSSFDFWFFHEVYIFCDHFARKFTEAKLIDRKGAAKPLTACPVALLSQLVTSSVIFLKLPLTTIWVYMFSLLPLPWSFHFLLRKFCIKGDTQTNCEKIKRFYRKVVEY